MAAHLTFYRVSVLSFCICALQNSLQKYTFSLLFPIHPMITSYINYNLRRGINTPASYSRHPGFNSRPGDRLSSGFSWISSVPPGNYCDSTLNNARFWDWRLSRGFSCGTVLCVCGRGGGEKEVDLRVVSEFKKNTTRTC
jgi:hypothetical protein